MKLVTKIVPGNHLIVQVRVIYMFSLLFFVRYSMYSFFVPFWVVFLQSLHRCHRVN